MKVIVDIFGGDSRMKFTNNLMHAGDVFESFKQLCECMQAEITADGEVDFVGIIKEKMESAGGYVIFVGIREIDGERVDPKAYVMPGVSMLSTGESWCLFSDALRRIGYQVEEDKNRRVINVKKQK